MLDTTHATAWPRERHRRGVEYRIVVTFSFLVVLRLAALVGVQDCRQSTCVQRDAEQRICEGGVTTFARLPALRFVTWSRHVQ